MECLFIWYLVFTKVSFLENTSKMDSNYIAESGISFVFTIKKKVNYCVISYFD